MRKNFKDVGFYPQPVLIIGTYDEDGTPDAMNAAWGGLYAADKVVLCLSEGHKTTANIKAKADLHASKSEFVDAPVIDEFPLTLDCKLLKVSEDGNIIGKIVNVSADERILGADGKIDSARFQPISFDPVHNDYMKLGEKVGNAFQDGAKLK